MRNIKKLFGQIKCKSKWISSMFTNTFYLKYILEIEFCLIQYIFPTLKKHYSVLSHGMQIRKNSFSKISLFILKLRIESEKCTCISKNSHLFSMLQWSNSRKFILFDYSFRRKRDFYVLSRSVKKKKYKTYMWMF